MIISHPDKRSPTPGWSTPEQRPKPPNFPTTSRAQDPQPRVHHLQSKDPNSGESTSSYNRHNYNPYFKEECFQNTRRLQSLQNGLRTTTCKNFKSIVYRASVYNIFKEGEHLKKITYFQFNKIHISPPRCQISPVKAQNFTSQLKEVISLKQIKWTPQLSNVMYHYITRKDQRKPKDNPIPALRPHYWRSQK